MIAHFYLLAESFQNNSNFSKVEVEEKIKRLSEDVNLIDKYKDTNVLYVNYEEVYPQILYSTYTIENIICNGYNLKSEGCIERDVFNAIQNIFINKSQETNYSLQKVKDELLPTINKVNCYGLIAFHRITGFNNDLQIIYGQDEWYKFRRYILSLHPSNGVFFVDECSKYYPNLFFHERNKTEVSHLLKDSAKKVVHYLSELNDKFISAKTNPYDRKESLKRFNSMCSFDQNASDEGNSGSKKKSKVKKKDTFDFLDINNKPVSVCCDLHLKILKDDNGKISTDRRIYFSEEINGIGLNKILIGHIGHHG
jgi:hypothetical protein